jgi:hypothetical protein
MWLMLLFLSM